MFFVGVGVNVAVEVIVGNFSVGVGETVILEVLVDVGVTVGNVPVGVGVPRIGCNDNGQTRLLSHRELGAIRWPFTLIGLTQDEKIDDKEQSQ